jgi:hydroxymethylpyrimidine pyrophosphatase-like HAD family hydrolase
LFTRPGGGWTPSATGALLRLHEAGVALVLVSGRTRGQIAELARAVSAAGYIAEMGALVVDRRPFPEEEHTAFGSFEGSGEPFEAMVRSGAGGFLLDRYRGLLEPHTPWSRHPRRATMLFRGQVNPEEAQAALQVAGYSWLRLADNGVIPRAFPGLDVEEVHAYHLVPGGVSKAAGVSRHLELTGTSGAGAAAIGDSVSDLELASVVGRMFVTANGRASVDEAALPANASFTDGSHGEGFAEAVDLLLDA